MSRASHARPPGLPAFLFLSFPRFFLNVHIHPPYLIIPAMLIGSSAQRVYKLFLRLLGNMLFYLPNNRGLHYVLVWGATLYSVASPSSVPQFSCNIFCHLIQFAITLQDRHRKKNPRQKIISRKMSNARVFAGSIFPTTWRINLQRVVCVAIRTSDSIHIPQLLRAKVARV